MWFSIRVKIFLPGFILLFVSRSLSPVPPLRDNRTVIGSDAQALLKEANRLSWLDNWTAAAPLYRRAEMLFRFEEDKRDEIFAHVGRIRASGEGGSWVQLSRALEKQLKDPIVKRDQALRLWCLAVKGYVDLDVNTEAAKRAWMEALAISEKLSQSQWTFRAKGELGVISFLQGNPTRAVSLVGQSLLALVESKDIAGQARLLAMLGDGYNEVHRYAEAHWFFSHAIALVVSTPDAGFPFNAEIGDAAALAGEGRDAQAIDLLNRVVAQARLEESHGHESDALLALADIAIKSQDLERAKEYLKTAAEIAQRFDLPRALAPAMIELAGVYRNEADYNSADAALKVGLIASRHVGDRYYLPRDLTAAAELKVAENKPDEAEFLFEQAEDDMDAVLVNQHTEIGQAALAGSISETYLRHFHLVARQGKVARALNVLERVRGRATATRFYETKSRGRSSAVQSKMQAALEANIASLQVALLATIDSKERQSIEDKILQNERTLALEDNEVSRKTWALLAPASLASVQGALRDDELLLEYVLDDPNAFCVAISADDARIFQLPAGNTQIQHLVTSYLRDLKAKNFNPNLAAQLYNILLKGPAEAFPKSRWIIAGDGILQFLPFEALRTSDGKFTLDSRIISYTPSATTFRVLRRARTPSLSRPLLAIGDVEYKDRNIPTKQTRGAWIPRSVVRDLVELSGSHLQDLPDSRQEVLSIAEIVGRDSKVLLGAQATESAFKAEGLSEYRIIHLAVHAISDSRYPDRAALVLAADKPPEDGLLQVREISRLHLNADLVTLSACQTGIGPTEGEAGMISLEQAFLMGGAKAVVASLWNVEDESTTLLMESFYRHLAHRQDMATALAEAKREFVGRPGFSPYYWAGFVVTGEASAPVSFGRQ